MSWEALATISEIISAVAVVISLVYLAHEIRTSNEGVRQSAMQEMLESLNDLIGETSTDGQFAEIWIRGLAADESLSAVELVRFRSWLVRLFHVYARLEELKLTVKTDSWVDSATTKVRQELVGSPGVKQWWAQRQEMFPQPFRNMIEKEMASSPGFKPGGIELATESPPVPDTGITG